MAGTNFAIGPDGSPVALTDEQAAAVHGKPGFTPISGDKAREQQRATDAANYVDQNWGTVGKALAGGASGLSLGLAPSIAARMGLVDRDRLEAAEETGAYQAGDIAGMIAPAVLSGGESLVGRGLAQGGLRGAGKVAAALTPAGVMGEAGGLAEALARRFLPEAGAMGSLATPALRMASRGAAEGAIINLAHTASDNIIQDKPFAAQALLASGLDGALFGGVTGGILGGAGSLASRGVSAAAGGAGRIAGSVGTAEQKAVKSLSFMGLTDKEIQATIASKGSAVNGLKQYFGTLDEAGVNLTSKPSVIHDEVAKTIPQYKAVLGDVKQELASSHATASPTIGRVAGRIDDIANTYVGELEHQNAQKIATSLKKELYGVEGMVKPAPIEPLPPARGAKASSAEWNQYRQAKTAYEAEKAAFVPTSPDELMGRTRSWEKWSKSRDQLADRVQQTSGMRKEIYTHALAALDGEIESAMTAADPGLFAKYSSATQQLRNAEFLKTVTSRKAIAHAAAPGVLRLDNSDAATIGYSLVTGANPLVGAGILAAKKLGLYAYKKFEPVVAEYTARSAMGAHAGAAEAKTKSALNGAMRGFLLGTKQEATREYLKPHPKLTMDSYQQYMDLADNLTSQAHQAKVKETVQALAIAGHPELAQEMGATYGRTVAAINQVKPKRGKDHAAGVLGKTPKAMGLDTAGIRFVGKLRAVRDPIGTLVRGLANNDLSRSDVQIIKATVPSIHDHLVGAAVQTVAEMKAAGKHVPADKLATLGVALDYPVDSKLTKPFIDQVQKALAVNKSPPPKQGGSGPPPVADKSSYQTPLQSSVG